MDIINLEEGYPTVREAILLLEEEVKYCKKKKEKLIYIIHGYGSSGKGGIIKQKTRTWLKNKLNDKYIHTVVYGEEFDLFNETARNLKNKYPCEELNELMKNFNEGVTIVEL